MNPSQVLLAEAHDQYWSVIQDCLREFHKMTVEEALSKSARLRKSIEIIPSETLEFFYHAEPFDVACDIANNRLNLEDYRERYLQIRDEVNGLDNFS